jgi:ABC-2 type transport system ATP-binding protein
VLLDEPTTGLDVDARHALWEAVRRQHAAGSTVVVTSHYLEEIEALAQRVVVMGGGRVLADDSLTGILSRVATRLVRLRSTAVDAITALDGVAHADLADGFATLTVHDSDAFITELVRSGLPFTDLTVRGASLEEAFLSLTDTAETERTAA